MEDFPSQTTCPLIWTILASQAEPDIQGRLNAAHNGQLQQIGSISISALGVIPVINLSVAGDNGFEIVNIVEAPSGFTLTAYDSTESFSYELDVSSSRALSKIDLLFGIFLGRITAVKNHQCNEQTIATAIAVMALTALHVRRIVGQ